MHEPGYKGVYSELDLGLAHAMVTRVQNKVSGANETEDQRKLSKKVFLSY